MVIYQDGGLRILSTSHSMITGPGRESAMRIPASRSTP
jgi:hypothetical protein